MRCIYAILFVFVLNLGAVVSAQGLTLKSNLLTDVSGSLSLGAEYGLSDKTSLSLMASYNPWEFSDNAKRKYLLIQPEYRKWLRGVYNGYFVGFQANYGIYNVGGQLPWYINSCDLIENNRYQGEIYGVGVTSGYQWILSSRLNLEVAGSIGYLYCTYDKYEREAGTPVLEQGIYNHWGITSLAVTLVYYIN